MAGLFSLGTGNNNTTTEEDQQHNPPTQIPPPPPTHHHHHHHPDSLFWYQKNEDVVSSYRGGFELWNQHHQQQFFPQAQPQPQPRSLFQHQDLYSSAAALGVGPSRPSDDNPLPSRSGFMMMSGSGSGISGGISCQDCGNQAKKDCPHIRCRTCCKSRGFDCQTHLKSTWVPAAKRRERQQQLAGLKKQQQQQQQRPDDEGEETEEDEEDINVPQRHRDQLQTSLACTRLPTNPTSLTGGLEEEVNFPAMVSSPAEFRCVRVSSVDESESEEYAYSTEVNIGGHVFRGILYDYGPDNNYMPPTTGNTCSSTLEGAVQQPLNLISTPIATTTTVVGAIVDPSSFYPAPLNTFMPPSGTQFFPHPRS